MKHVKKKKNILALNWRNSTDLKIEAVDMKEKKMRWINDLTVMVNAKSGHWDENTPSFSLNRTHILNIPHIETNDFTIISTLGL